MAEYRTTPWGIPVLVLRSGIDETEIHDESHGVSIYRGGGWVYLDKRDFPAIIEWLQSYLPEDD